MSSQALESNARGIPKAPFIEDVENYVGNGSVEEALKKLQEMLSKYKFMNENTLSRRHNMEEKIPELEETLQLVNVLSNQKSSTKKDDDLDDEDEEEDISEFETTYELSETLYAKAKVKSCEEVYLWLGANVMLAYPIDEAVELLTNKLESARKNLSNAKEDLDWLRSQMTTTEVNVARVYNYDVKKRREEREKAATADLNVDKLTVKEDDNDK